jgi:hypothetical protein
MTSLATFATAAGTYRQTRGAASRAPAAAAPARALRRRAPAVATRATTEVETSYENGTIGACPSLLDQPRASPTLAPPPFRPR